MAGGYNDDLPQKGNHYFYDEGDFLPPSPFSFHYQIGSEDFPIAPRRWIEEKGGADYTPTAKPALTPTLNSAQGQALYSAPQPAQMRGSQLLAVAAVALLVWALSQR